MNLWVVVSLTFTPYLFFTSIHNDIYGRGHSTISRDSSPVINLL